MTLRLRVAQSAWESTVVSAAAGYGSVVPVVKGTGYGFGCSALMPIASRISNEFGNGFIAVGSVFETADVPEGHTAMVLTPHLGELPVTLARDAVLTVGSNEHVDALAQQGWDSPVVVKVLSSMRRHGIDRSKASDLIAHANASGLEVIGLAYHPPLVTDTEDNFDEVRGLLDRLPPNSTVFLSHLQSDAFKALQREFEGMQLSIRIGTGLWHADKSLMHLSADVLSVQDVEAESEIGYHRVNMSKPGVVAVIGAGSSHGVAALDGGLSPFHYAKRRLDMIEKPHMHTSMVFIPEDMPAPHVGDWIDVQRPLTATSPDELHWVSASAL